MWGDGEEKGQDVTQTPEALEEGDPLDGFTGCAWEQERVLSQF